MSDHADIEQLIADGERDRAIVLIAGRAPKGGISGEDMTTLLRLLANTPAAAEVPITDAPAEEPTDDAAEDSEPEPKAEPSVVKRPRRSTGKKGT